MLVVRLGLVREWEDYMHRSFRATPLGKWTGKTYFGKAIGTQEEVDAFQQWLTENLIEPDHQVEVTSTRMSPRALFYFNSDDFAMLLKLAYEVQDESNYAHF